MMVKGINWIAVLVAVVLLEVVGYLWYGALFVKAWTNAIVAYGHTPTTGNMAVTQSIGVINTLLIVLGLAWLTARLGARSLTACIGVALAAWFFFDLTTQALEYLYMQMPAKLVGLNIGYQLVSYVLAGAVLGLIKPKTAA